MLLLLLSVVILLCCLQICRMALDTETMEGQPADRDKFLEVFYDHYIHWLVEPFWLPDLAEGALMTPSRETNTLYNDSYIRDFVRAYQLFLAAEITTIVLKVCVCVCISVLVLPPRENE